MRIVRDLTGELSQQHLVGSRNITCECGTDRKLCGWSHVGELRDTRQHQPKHMLPRFQDKFATNHAAKSSSLMCLSCDMDKDLPSFFFFFLFFLFFSFFFFFFFFSFSCVVLLARVMSQFLQILVPGFYDAFFFLFLFL